MSVTSITYPERTWKILDFMVPGVHSRVVWESAGRPVWSVPSAERAPMSTESLGSSQRASGRAVFVAETRCLEVFQGLWWIVMDSQKTHKDHGFPVKPWIYMENLGFPIEPWFPMGNHGFMGNKFS